MSQVHLTPEQVAAIATLPSFDGLMVLTQHYSPEYVRVVVAKDHDITAECNIAPDGKIEATA